MDLHTVFRFLLTVYFYTVVSITFIISLVVQCIEGVLLLPLLLLKPRLRVVILGQTHLGLMDFAYLLCRPFWKRRVVRSFPAGPTPKKVIVVVNHTSKVDPWVVGSVLLGKPALYVVKRSLLKVPIAGWAQYLAGCLSVGFTSEKGGWGTVPGAVQDMMKEALKALADGIWVVVFPEGTRSVTGRLQPFKNGFFRLVAENPDICILPIAVDELRCVAGHHYNWLLVLHMGTYAVSVPTYPLDSYRIIHPNAFAAQLCAMVTCGNASLGKTRFDTTCRALVRLRYAALHNNFRLWSVNNALLSPGTSYIAVGDYISPKGLSAEQLRDKTREAIFELLKLSPEFDPLREQPLAEMARARGHGL